MDKSFDDNVDDLLEGMSDEEPPVTITPSATLLSSHLMSLITTTAPSSTSSTASASGKDGMQNRIPTQAEKDKASFKNQVTICLLSSQR